MIDVVVDRVDAVLDAASEVAATLRGSSPSPLGGDLDPWRVLLDGDDRAAISARRFPSDRRRTLAGRLVLRSLLLDRLGRSWRDLPDLLVCRTCDSCGAAHGRPRYPSMSLSSASSDGWVAAAVGTEQAAVGIDIEVHRESTWSGFDGAALHPVEREHFRRHGSAARPRLQRWADKEAVLKAAGVGLRVDPAALRIAEHSGTRTALRCAPVREAAGSTLEWRRVVVSPTSAVEGFSVAAITASPDRSEAVASIASTSPDDVRLRRFAGLDL